MLQLSHLMVIDSDEVSLCHHFKPKRKTPEQAHKISEQLDKLNLKQELSTTPSITLASSNQNDESVC